MTFFKKKRIYADFAGATPVDSSVMKVFVRTLALYANPHGLSRDSLDARVVLEQSRETVAKHFGMRPQEIIFTSGGTEGDNLAILGVVNHFRRNNPGKIPHIITSVIEHSAVRETCRTLCRYKLITLDEIPVDKHGVIDLSLFKKACTKETVLVSIQYANSEIGTIQPLVEIAKVIRHVRKESGAAYPIFHTDAAQAVAYCPIHIPKLGVDLLSSNGGKIYAPKQTGILVVKTGTPIDPVMYGGNQEFGLRAGTVSVAHAAAYAEALTIAVSHKDKEFARLCNLQSYLTNALSKVSGITFNSTADEQLPTIVNISVHGVPSDRLMIELDAQGITVSEKSACKSDDSAPSYVITALGHDGTDGSLRISIGVPTTKKDIDRIISSLSSIISRIRQEKEKYAKIRL